MRRALPVLGAMVAVAFCGLALWKGSRDLPEVAWSDPRLWGWLAVALVLYILSQLLAAWAWAGTLWVFSIRLPGRRAEAQLLVSQIGKYIPGNVAHLLGRYALARADGVPGASFALSLLVEIGMVLVAGAALLVFLLLAAPGIVTPLLPAGSGLSDLGLSRLIMLALASAIALCLWIIRARLGQAMGETTIVLSRVALPIVLHGVNFLILGLSLTCVIAALVPGAEAGIMVPVAVFIVAWTVGFLTPGAPGGIGVREGLIVFGLGLAIGHGPALAVALLHRALAIAGDLACFALGLIVRQTSSR